MHGQSRPNPLPYILQDRALCCDGDDRGDGEGDKKKGKKLVGVSALHMFTYAARIGTTCPTFDPNRDEYVLVRWYRRAAEQTQAANVSTV